MKAVDLDLLNTYHPRVQISQSTALAQAAKFLLLSLMWIGIVFAIAGGGAITFAWLLPELLKILPASLIKPELAKQLASIIAFLAPTVTIAAIIPANATFMVLCERKFLALLTMRIGPEKVGFNGALQTFADALKLLFKEDIIPEGSDPLLFTLAPALFFAPAMVVFMPLLSIAANNSGIFASTDLDLGLLFILAVLSLGTMSLVMGGWASNNKYSLIGGLRSSAQAISYEISLVLAMISIILVTGSSNLMQISDKQIGGILQWNIFGNGVLKYLPNIFASSNGNFMYGFVSLFFVLLCFALFLIFVLSSTAEVNRIPFDLPEAESELVSGYNTEYTGMKFALFFLAEYTNLFIASGLAVVLFFGASHLPISGSAEQALYQSLSDISLALPFDFCQHLNLVWLVTSLCFLVKIYLMFLLSIWIRATLPRMRQDQLMEFGWKYLIPITLAMVFFFAFCVEYLSKLG